MKLYHGSNIEVKIPRIIPNLRALDFGAGFYVTSSENQASRWGKSVTKRRGAGEATLNIYEIISEEMAKLNILKFEKADASWLDFVVGNRKEILGINPYDIVIGPVANDSTLPVIDDYMSGIYTKEEAVKRLLPQNLTDQYAFLTERAIRILIFERSEMIK